VFVPGDEGFGPTVAGVSEHTIFYLAVAGGIIGLLGGLSGKVYGVAMLYAACLLNAGVAACYFIAWILDEKPGSQNAGFFFFPTMFMLILCSTAVAVPAYFVGLGVRRLLTRTRERRRDRCLSCGYCLTGLTESRCPECGRSFAESHRS
jgi:hypothetical protein